MRPILWPVVLLLFISGQLRAEPAETAETTDVEHHFDEIAQENEMPAPVDQEPWTPITDAAEEPAWCASPYERSEWKVGLDFIPTETPWDRDWALALRLNVDRVDPSGAGRRGQLWFFNQDPDRWSGASHLTASTFYYDYYKRLFIEKGEFALGGGFATGYAHINGTSGRDPSFFGGGGSIFGEGFYPLLRYAKTDIGMTWHGRLGLLLGNWFDDHVPIHDFDESWFTIVEELTWGLELRRRFGQHQQKYWSLSVSRDLQLWSSPSFPYSAGADFQGTAVKFGIAW